MSDDLITQWIASVASLVDKQLYCTHLVRGNAWHFDLRAGAISFAKQYRWQTQVLATESEASGTWLWAWANTDSNIPTHLLVASLALKAYGDQNGIPELTTPHLSLDQVDGSTLALFASGICDANAYYGCPYEGGALFVLIMDENFPKCTDPPLQRIATVFPQAIASLEIPDHKLALTGYLEHYGLSHEQDGEKIVVKENGEVVLAATFDEQNRLTKLEAKLEGAEPKSDAGGAVESWNEMQLRRMLGG